MYRIERIGDECLVECFADLLLHLKCAYLPSHLVDCQRAEEVKCRLVLLSCPFRVLSAVSQDAGAGNSLRCDGSVSEGTWHKAPPFLG